MQLVKRRTVAFKKLKTRVIKISMITKTKVTPVMTPDPSIIVLVAR